MMSCATMWTPALLKPRWLWRCDTYNWCTGHGSNHNHDTARQLQLNLAVLQHMTFNTVRISHLHPSDALAMQNSEYSISNCTEQHWHIWRLVEDSCFKDAFQFQCYSCWPRDPIWLLVARLALESRYEWHVCCVWLGHVCFHNWTCQEIILR